MKHGLRDPNLTTSGDFNFCNRQVRTRMPGGAGGARSGKL